MDTCALENKDTSREANNWSKIYSADPVKKAESVGKSEDFVRIKKVENEWKDASYVKNKLFDPVFDQLRSWIFNFVIIPEQWKEEDIELPNVGSKLLTLDLCYCIYGIYKLFPMRIALSAEGGMFVSYRRMTNRIHKSLKFEIYNDLVIGAVIGDDYNKKIIFNEDITIDKLESIMKIYQS